MAAPECWCAAWGRSSEGQQGGGVVRRLGPFLREKEARFLVDAWSSCGPATLQGACQPGRHLSSGEWIPSPSYRRTRPSYLNCSTEAHLRRTVPPIQRWWWGTRGHGPAAVFSSSLPPRPWPCAASGLLIADAGGLGKTLECGNPLQRADPSRGRAKRYPFFGGPPPKACLGACSRRSSDRFHPLVRLDRLGHSSASREHIPPNQ